MKNGWPNRQPRRGPASGAAAEAQAPAPARPCRKSIGDGHLEVGAGGQRLGSSALALAESDRPSSGRSRNSVFVPAIVATSNSPHSATNGAPEISHQIELGEDGVAGERRGRGAAPAMCPFDRAAGATGQDPRGRPSHARSMSDWDGARRDSSSGAGTLADRSSRDSVSHRVDLLKRGSAGIATVGPIHVSVPMRRAREIDARRRCEPRDRQHQPAPADDPDRSLVGRLHPDHDQAGAAGHAQARPAADTSARGPRGPSPSRSGRMPRRPGPLGNT